MTCSPDQIHALQLLREKFDKRWGKARQSAGFGLDLEDLKEPTDDATGAANAAIYHERHCCGSCTVNYVGGKLEPVLFDYLRVLELACGLDPRNIR